MKEVEKGYERKEGWRLVNKRIKEMKKEDEESRYKVSHSLLKSEGFLH
jgi:hypothetical protein